MSSMVAGSAAGPALLTLGKDLVGSYREGLLLCCGFSLAALLFTLVARVPPAKERPTADL